MDFAEMILAKAFMGGKQENGGSNTPLRVVTLTTVATEGEGAALTVEEKAAVDEAVAAGMPFILCGLFDLGEASVTFSSVATVMVMDLGAAGHMTAVAVTFGGTTLMISDGKFSVEPQ